MKWLSYIFLATLFLACSKKTSVIATDPSDPRLKTISGTWYQIPYDNYYVKIYNRSKNDSANSIMSFNDGKTVLLKNLNKHPNFNGEKHFFLKGNFLFVEKQSNDNEFVKWEIQEFTADLLRLRYRGNKDITEPFLCGDGELFKISMKPAVFGYSKSAFSDFINQNADSLDTYPEGAVAVIQFDVNCEGKVCNVKHFEDMYSETRFANQMKEIVGSMPDWQAGMQRDKYVNFQFVKLFELKNNKIEIRDTR